MQRRAHVLIFGAVAAVTAVTVYALSGDDLGEGPSARASPGKPRASDLAAEPGGSALRAELNTVRGTVQQLARTQANLQLELERAAAERGGADAVREQAADGTRVESEDPTAADREASELALRCDAKILSEPVDSEWSRAKSEQVGAFLARPPLAGTKLKAVDCRTTMCRIELSHRSNEDRSRFIQSFSDLAGPRGMIFAHIETANDLDIVVYVTRDGVGFP